MPSPAAVGGATVAAGRDRGRVGSSAPTDARLAEEHLVRGRHVGVHEVAVRAFGRRPAPRLGQTEKIAQATRTSTNTPVPASIARRACGPGAVPNPMTMR